MMLFTAISHTPYFYGQLCPLTLSLLYLISVCSLGCLLRHVNEGQQVTTHKQREIHSLQLMKAFSFSPTNELIKMNLPCFLWKKY